MTSPALATVQLLGAVVAIALASYAYRHRDRPGVIWLVAVLFGNTVWMVAAGINYATGSTTVSTAMLQVRYVGITVIPVALLFFALSYTGTDEWLGRRRQLLIASPAAGALALALTDHVHGLFYAGVTPASNPQQIAYEYGMVAVPWIAYAFVLVVAAAAVFVRYATITDGVYRWQALALAGVVLMGTAADVLYFLPVPPTGFAITPLAILLSSAIAVGLVVRYDFVRLVPATRELGRRELIERMELGMVVLDADGRVIDVNPAAAKLLECDLEAVIGEQAPDSLPGPNGPAIAERTFNVDGIDRDVEIRTHRVDVGSGITLLTLRQLDDLTDVVSHDLQGPLMEIRGSADMAIATGDITHVDRVLAAANRIDDLATDLLELAHTGRGLEARESVELAEIAETAWRHLWTPETELVVETDRSVIGDPDRIQQLFENLLRNSVEHASSDHERGDDGIDTIAYSEATGDDVTQAQRTTRKSTRESNFDPVDERETAPADGGRIVVGSLPTGFYLEDDGPGIPPEKRERIFEKGYTTSQTGTGLGLSIVGRIVAAHGWSVRATEGSLGGARIEITDVDFVDESERTG
ncbi:histidine kinase N-terminal 7TM domain-containing protein [Natrialba swarupiae]|uniref:histidine kinase n=1 Tax=Natrialba swarupiae TaxID=2448032 RepID=A0A5D5AGW6_9EURY|nr:histidine kinase N-terminal 7TM domain-containing protein [Natrialba swarupiae]TYT61079.1 PAS domain-containing protein [Natrialba swarupiae]